MTNNKEDKSADDDAMVRRVAGEEEIVVVVTTSGWRSMIRIRIWIGGQADKDEQAFFKERTCVCDLGGISEWP